MGELIYGSYDQESLDLEYDMRIRCPHFAETTRAFPCRLRRLWMRALRRRSQRARFSWRRLVRMTDITGLSFVRNQVDS